MSQDPWAAFEEAWRANDLEAAQKALEAMTLALWWQSGRVTDAAMLLRVMQERKARSDPGHSSVENDPNRETDDPPTTNSM